MENGIYQQIQEIALSELSKNAKQTALKNLLKGQKEKKRFREYGLSQIYYYECPEVKKAIEKQAKAYKNYLELEAKYF